MYSRLDEFIPQVDVPEGIEGDWKVERFKISKAESEFSKLRAVFHPREYVQPGRYTRLVRGRSIIMSDTLSERLDHQLAVHRAHGRILINGLGLGMVLNACLRKPEVDHATVVEISPDVIKLVAPHYQKRYGERLTIVEADALTWRPKKGSRFGMVWHDIWDTISGDNLPEMTKLHRSYGRRTEWQGSWCKEICRR
jgi:hypothetical protein